ncbi:MAG: glutamate--tRNA ligase [Planctomycetes bacterium]|nr:glutamate--tRNA ligase [Planctomycetota bacterium]
MSDIRTRFAPSPTGYMHIGGMRTALFNWLWARHHGGRFVLRIDDTDRERNVDEALAPILHAFRWLGLDWDEGPEVGGSYGPYFQSQRNEFYQQAAQQLLDAGLAYRDFDPPELIRQDRQAAEKEKRTYLNVRRSLDLSDSDRQRFLDAGKPSVVRFLIPRSETVQLEDEIRGHVEWDCALIPDPVIQRGDGSPLYNFATVVDDAQMQISHVIRAEEHLSNTPVQILIHRALGQEIPRFAHIPYVAAPGTKEKLSKREKSLEKYRRNPKFQKMFAAGDALFPRIGLDSSDSLNPVMVEYYEKIGYLPAGVLNALVRLGWSLDEKTEIFSLPEMIENFSLQRVVKAPAGLDPDKLNSYQSHWMGALSQEERTAGCLEFLQQAGIVPASPDEDRDGNSSRRDDVGRLVAVLGDRIRLFSDILEFDEYFVADDQLPFDEKAFEKRLQNAPDSVELLREFRDELAAAEPFDAATTERTLKEFVEKKGVKIGELIHALRVAVTGKPKGPGMFDCLELLGRERCLNRIERTLSRLRP